MDINTSPEQEPTVKSSGKINCDLDTRCELTAGFRGLTRPYIVQDGPVSVNHVASSLMS